MWDIVGRLNVGLHIPAVIVDDHLGTSLHLCGDAANSRSALSRLHFRHAGLLGRLSSSGAL